MFLKTVIFFTTVFFFSKKYYCYMNLIFFVCFLCFIKQKTIDVFFLKPESFILLCLIYLNVKYSLT